VFFYFTAYKYKETSILRPISFNLTALEFSLMVLPHK
jgi:hypothetical protein